MHLYPHQLDEQIFRTEIIPSNGGHLSMSGYNQNVTLNRHLSMPSYDQVNKQYFFFLLKEI
jgi:hypothetical protein